jgi:hypothetical protein
VRTALGVLLLLGHAALLPVLLQHARRPGLEVGVAEAAAAGDGPPGLHYQRWQVTYRGGHTRAVGAAHLVGPFQDPAAPGCGARVVVGQRLLDDGAAGPGTVAHLVRGALERELAGRSLPGAGAYRRVAEVSARWATFDEPGDRRLFGGLAGEAIALRARLWRTGGYARIRAVIELERVRAEVVVAAVPRVADGQLTFELFADARLRAGHRVVDWALDALGIDRHASRAVRAQLDDAVIRVFAPPPPLALPGGRTLRVTYCPDAHLAVEAGGFAALPLTLQLEAPAAGVLPPRLGPVPPPPPAPGTSLAFDLDLDTVNALLHALWRTGYLDEQLAEAGLDRRVNEHPEVTALLTLRLSPLRLALPPVVSPGPGGLRLAADLRLQLADRATITPARLWAALDVALDPGTAGPAAAGRPGAGEAPPVRLAELELSCEPAPGRLRPCYGGLVAAARARAGDARAELSAVLVDVLDRVFTGRRVAAAEAGAALALGPPRTSAHLAGASATVRIEVAARLDELP